MRHPTRIARRGLFMLMIAAGLMGLAINPATARELCNENGTLALADGNDDGVVSRGEIQAIIDAAGNAEGVDQLQSLLNSLPGDVTGIRYVDCADTGSGTDDGSGTGDDGSGTGDDGSGADDGSGDGGSGSGNGSGTGTGTGTGTGDGSGTDDNGSGAGAGSGAGGEIVINAQGTPVDAITGLPDTGQGTGSGVQFSGPVAVGLGLSLALGAAALGAYSLRTRPQSR